MNACPPSRGMALVEAMVASAVLAVGVLGAARLGLHAQASAREARAMALAQTLAGEALDCALAAQAPCPASPSVTLAGVRYTVTLERSSLNPRLQGVQATVEWLADGGSTPRRLRWQTRVSAVQDANGNTLGVSSP